MSSVPASCNRCGHTWTALRVCHCAACCRPGEGARSTFAGLALFDRHRDQHGERGKCIDPATLSGIEFRDGMWRSPEMTDEQKLAAFGSAGR